jgi:hypothetical protein
MPKTGTTAIQDVFYDNRKTLAKKGVLYAESGLLHGRKNHNGLLSCLLKLSPESTALDDLHREIKRTKCDHIVLSHEAFSVGYIFGYLDERDAAWKRDSYFQMPGLLQAALGRYDVKIVVYVRRQDAMLQSLLNQYIKDGRFGSRINIDTDFMQTLSVYYEYLRLDSFLQRWTDAFGQPNIIVRPCERSQYVDGDILADFCSLVGYAHPEKLRREGSSVNPSLSPKAAAFALTLYRHFEDLQIKDLRAFNLFVMHVLERSQAKEIYRKHALLTKNQCLEIYDHFRESNAQVAQAYMGRDDGVLFENTDFGDEQGWLPSIRTQDAMQVAIALWKRAQ